MITQKPYDYNNPGGDELQNHSRIAAKENKFEGHPPNQVIIHQYWQTEEENLEILALKRAFNGDALLYLTKRYGEEGEPFSQYYKISFFRLEDSGEVKVTNSGYQLGPELTEEIGVLERVHEVIVTGKHRNVVILRFNYGYLMTLCFSLNGKKLLSREITTISLDKEDLSWASFWLKRPSPESQYLYAIFRSETIFVKKLKDERFLEHRAIWRMPDHLVKRSQSGMALTGTFHQICCLSETRLIALICFRAKKDYLKLYILDYCDESSSFVLTPVANHRFNDSFKRTLYTLNGEVFMKNAKNEVFRIEV